MPNNVTHRVRVTGDPDECRRMVHECFVPDGAVPPDTRLSFRRVLPMPAELEDTEARFSQSPPDAAEKANLEAYGHRNWYDWACAHWGTKWDCYSFRWVRREPGDLEFVFDTAWSPPVPVLEALAARYRLLTFDVCCHDEGDGFAGAGTLHGLKSSFATEPATRALYERVHGHPRDEEDDEDDEDPKEEPDDD